jgi:hypothetical protein
MALVRDFEIPGTGLIVPNAYHVIVKVNTEKRLNDIPPPPDSSRPDGLTENLREEVYWKAGYVGRISIEIFTSKQARDEGKNAIGAITINPTDVHINGIVSSDIKDFDLNFFIDPTSELSIVDQAYEHLKELEYYKESNNI